MLEEEYIRVYVHRMKNMEGYGFGFGHTEFEVHLTQLKSQVCRCMYTQFLNL